MIDPIGLSVRMQRLRPWLDAVSGLGGEHRRFDGAPFGSALVVIDPATRGGRGPATNRNGIHLCGVGAGLDAAGLDALLALFADAGTGPPLIHLTAGPAMDRARDLIHAAGFERHRWVRYPVLALAATAAPQGPADITVRAVDRAEALAARAAMSAAMRARLAAGPGGPDVHHLLAFDGPRPAGHAMLACREGLAWFGWLSARVPERRAATEQALIAAGVATARELGAAQIVSETLTVLAASRAHFARAGFHEVYERETYRPMGSGTLGGGGAPR